MEQVREERILVTVKTYPTLSQKYGETVCTAGVREDGSWVRLYSVSCCCAASTTGPKALVKAAVTTP